MKFLLSEHAGLRAGWRLAARNNVLDAPSIGAFSLGKLKIIVGFTEEHDVIRQRQGKADVLHHAGDPVIIRGHHSAERKSPADDTLRDTDALPSDRDSALRFRR